MVELRGRPLYSFRLDLASGIDLGETPVGHRLVFDFLGGHFEGRVNGKLLRSGADWLLIDRAGTSRLDIRLVLELDDGALATAQFGGRIVFPGDAQQMSQSERAALDPSRYYFRVAPTYETASVKYHWLNDIQALGICRFVETGIAGEVFEVL